MVSILAVQLMVKHRWIERRDRLHLEDFEKKTGGLEVISKRPRPQDVREPVTWQRLVLKPTVGTVEWLEEHSSGRWWTVGVASFALINISIMVLVVVAPDLLATG